jgi:hypothetical protein
MLINLYQAHIQYTGSIRRTYTESYGRLQMKKGQNVSFKDKTREKRAGPTFESSPNRDFYEIYK